MPLRLLSSVLAAACAACSGLPDTAVPAPPVSDAPQSIPPGFVLHIRAPRWQARVEGDAVLLTGPDRQRRLAIDANEPVFDGRVVRARDAAGAIELRVTERLCLDGPSGSPLPYTGRLQLGGGSAVTGCGEPLPAGGVR